MEVRLGIIGMPNVSITCFTSPEDEAKLYKSWLDRGNDMGSEMPEKLAKRNRFHKIRQRLAIQGATDVRFFPA